MHVIRPEEIHNIPTYMACGIVIAKKSDIDIILKESDNVPWKRWAFKFPSKTTRLVRKPCTMPAHTKTEPHIPQNDLVQVRNIRHNVHFSYAVLEPFRHLDNGKPRLVSEKNSILLLSNTIYALTSCQNTTNIWTTGT